MGSKQERPVNKSEFSRIAGVSRPAILKACKSTLAPAVLDSGRIDLAHPAAKFYVEKHGGKIPRKKPERKAQGGKKKAGQGDNKPEPSEPQSAPEQPPEPDPDPEPQDEPKAEPTPRNQRGGYAKRRNEIEAAPVPEVGPDDEGVEHSADVPEKIEPFADMTLRQLISRFGTETAFKDWLAALKSIEDIHEKRLKNAKAEGELISRDLVERHVLGAFEAAHINLLTDGAQTIASRVSAMSQAGADDAEIQQFVADTMSKMIKAAKSKAAKAVQNA